MTVSRSKVGVVVGQLGTPTAPTPHALRPYLRQFLSDMRVIDYHPLAWQPVLHGIILRTRPRRSAKLYARIWTDEGSPLLVYSRQQVELLQARLGDAFEVVLGMRYGQPGLIDAIRGLEARGIDRIVVLPMYPQYSSTTTASIYDGAYQGAAGRRCPLFNERKRFVPTLRFVEPYFDHPGYIESMCRHLTAQIDSMDAPPDVTILTFHGIPNRYIQTGDPYRAQCDSTARLLAEAMGWDESQWRVSFQSRFGPEKWLEPYTDGTIEQLAHEKAGRVLVFSPGFTTDCLETLDELGNEGREAFVEAGGSEHDFTLAPCLNANPDWIDVLAGLVRQNAAGWTDAASTHEFHHAVEGATLP
ncbi:MAG: ferrochelatase [Chloroflexi bacterium]|nr:ferrochelatase [Chloroflexota bacterium]